MLDIRVLRPGDDWVVNMIDRDGKDGITYAKRFHLGGFTRDKEYQLTQGTKGSRIFFLTVHPNEEDSSTMSVNVYLKNQLRRLRRPIPFDFGNLRVKGRGVLGNIVTKNQVERIARIMPAAAEQVTEEQAVPTSVDSTITPTETVTPPAESVSTPPAETETPTILEHPDATQLDLGF